MRWGGTSGRSSSGYQTGYVHACQTGRVHASRDEHRRAKIERCPSMLPEGLTWAQKSTHPVSNRRVVFSGRERLSLFASRFDLRAWGSACDCAALAGALEASETSSMRREVGYALCEITGLSFSTWEGEGRRSDTRRSERRQCDNGTLQG